MSALGLLGLWVELHLVEQYSADSLWRQRVERMTCQLGDACFDVLQFLIQYAFRLLESSDIDAHASQFHVSKHLDQRHLNLIEEFFKFFFLQLVLEDLV